MKLLINKNSVIFLLFLLILILFPNIILASNKIPDKILSSTVFLFKKDNNKNEIPIGTGVVVENGNILINYSAIAPYEVIIPNSNNRYSKLAYTDINNIVLRNYSNNQYYSTTINKIIAFDKGLNLLLLEPSKKIGKPVGFNKTDSKNNSISAYTIPYYINNNTIDFLDITRYNITPNKNESLIGYNVIHSNITNVDTLAIITKHSTFFFNENSELVTPNNIYLGKSIEFLKYEEFLQFRKQFYEDYKLLLNKKNGDQFEQFYVTEQFNTIYNRTTQILYIDNICKRLKLELYNVKKISYFNNIEEYDKLKEDIDIFINTFESSTLYESTAEDLYQLGLKEDAIYCMFMSSLENGSLNKIKYCKWLIEDKQTVRALSVLQNSYNNYNDWRILSEIDILISYCELLSGNLKTAELYKNKAVEHGILFYNSYEQDITDKYKYIIDKLDAK